MDPIPDVGDKKERPDATVLCIHIKQLKVMSYLSICSRLRVQSLQLLIRISFASPGFLLWILLIGLPLSTYAQTWETQSTLKYPSVRTLRVNPANDALVVEGGQFFYSSTDLGANWQPWGPVDGETLFPSRTLLDFSGDTLFIHVSDPGDQTATVYSSTDAGQTWQQRGSASLPIQFGVYPKSFLVDQNTLYLGFNDTLFQSTDYGDSYTKEVSTTGGSRLFLDGPMFFFDGALHVRREVGGIYRRTGTGSWSWLDTLSGGSNAFQGKAHQVENNFLYYYTFSPNGIASLEAGSSQWEVAELELQGQLFDTYDMLIDGNRMLASSRAGLAYSDDNGASFAMLDTHGLPQAGAQVDHYGGIVQAGDYYVVGGNWGILRAHRDTLLFTAQNRGFDTMNVAVQQVYPLDQGGFIQDDAAGLFAGDPQGEMPYVGATIPTTNSQFLDRFNGQYILGAFEGVFASEDGIEWNRVYPGGNDPSLTRVFDYSIHDGRLVIIDNGALKSTYDLQTWTDVTLDIPAPYQHVLIWDDRIYVTKRFGDPKGVYVADTTDLITTRLYEGEEAVPYTDGNHLFLEERSTLLRNNGPTDSSWQTITIDENVSMRDFLAYENVIWVATFSGPYYTTDGGDSWTLLNDGLPSNFGGVSAFAGVERDTLYGYTNTSISSLDLSSLLSSGLESTPEMTVSIYPNPARDMLHLNKLCNVVYIYDLSGREVLRDRMTQRVDLQDLQPGYYVLRTAGGAAAGFIKE